MRAFTAVLDESARDMVLPGVNVSDREVDWQNNYRVPDVVVIPHNNAGTDCDTHWCGGPDLVVEILSPNDRAREKLGFYAGLGVRETLIIDRHPWALELYRLEKGELQLVGSSTPSQPEILASSVLPVTFQLVAGGKRPAVEISRADHSQIWLV